MNQIPLIVSIEGNIGIGKSTLLNNLELSYKLKGITGIIILREPEEEWNLICDQNNESILSKFYKNPEKYSFAFQILVLKTMVDQLLKTIVENPNCEIIICERSILSSYHVFAKMLYDFTLMNEIEYKIYQSVYDTTYKNNSQIIQQKIIYLNCPPEKCYERIKKRNRKGEENIDLDYLKKCNDYHESWLNDENDKTIMKMNMDSSIEYDLRNKENIGFKWIEQINDFIF
jgi:deoxyadenosine/deoxycytidine kinase